METKKIEYKLISRMNDKAISYQRTNKKEQKSGKLVMNFALDIDSQIFYLEMHKDKLHYLIRSKVNDKVFDVSG